MRRAAPQGAQPGLSPSRHAPSGPGPQPHVVAEVVRIHRSAQLVGDGPEGGAQFLLDGVGHADAESQLLKIELRFQEDQFRVGTSEGEIRLHAV